MNTEDAPSPSMPPDYDVPLAKRFLDIVMAGQIGGCDPDTQALAAIAAFDELYPRGTGARETILLAAHVELMVDAMPPDATAG